MKLRSEIRLREYTQQIGLRDSVLLIGSCFTAAIGGRMQSHLFDAVYNPFGTVYDPASICRMLSACIRNDPSSLFRPVQRESRLVSMFTHSNLSADSSVELLSLIREKTASIHQKLKSICHLILSPGTAKIYTEIASDEIVANCHKQAEANFEKRMMTADEIRNVFSKVIAELKALNPDVNVTFTISPVRHLADGLEQNFISKSLLRNSIWMLEQADPFIQYFPAYEMLNDDLRDYRFYTEDLAHPSEQAENYIWYGFADALMDEEAQQWMNEWERMLKAFAHRPFHPESREYLDFRMKMMDKVRMLDEKFRMEGKAVDAARAGFNL